MPSDRQVAVLLVALFVSTPILATTATAQPSEGCNGEAKNKVVEKDSYGFHVEYTFQFSPESNKYCVLIENKGKNDFPAVFNSQVDGVTAAPEVTKLAPGESKYVEKNVTEHLNVIKDNHTVKLGVFQQEFVYNFTQELNATSQAVAAPTIRDVEVVRNEGSSSTSLRVTVENPSERGYNIYVQAKTLDTERVDEVGSPQPNETVRYTLPLEEGTGAVVAGKVRIFDNWGESRSKFDQKEFLARPDEDAEVWDKPFEHMPGTNSAASYSNETSKQYREGYVNDEYLSERASKIGAVGAVVVLAGLVWWRRRR